MENIIYFNKDLKDVDEKSKKRFGIRGRRAVDLAQMGLPIAPGFIIDSELTKKLPQINLKEIIKTHIDRLAKEVKKGFGDTKKPLLLKVVLSSDLNVPNFPSIHNIGLNDKTVEGFGLFTGPDFSYGEYRFLLRSIGSKIHGIDIAEFDKIEGKGVKQKAAELKKVVENYKKYLGDKFSEDVYDQLGLILKGAAARYCDSEIDVDNSLSIMVQAMVYGNFGQNSYAGNYYTRNIITGDPLIQGNFLQNEFDVDRGKPKDIAKIEKKYFDKFADIAKKVEETSRRFARSSLRSRRAISGWSSSATSMKIDAVAGKTLLDLCKKK